MPATKKATKSSMSGIYCPICKDKTKTAEPITIVNKGRKSFYISGRCCNCKQIKTKNNISTVEKKQLPTEILKSKKGAVFENKIVRNGGVFPLAALIPLISAGVSVVPWVVDTVKGIFGKSGSGLIGDDVAVGPTAPIATGGEVSTANKDAIIKAIKLLSGNGFTFW